MIPPGPTLTILQPPMAPWAVASAVCCEEIAPTPDLVAWLAAAGSDGLLVLASAPEGVLLHSARGTWRVERKSLRGLSLHPVLPAKGGGGFHFCLDLEEEHDIFPSEFLYCGSHSEELDAWCNATARDLAHWLGLPLKKSEPSYDC